MATGPFERVGGVDHGRLTPDAVDRGVESKTSIRLVRPHERPQPRNPGLRARIDRVQVTAASNCHGRHDVHGGRRTGERLLETQWRRGRSDRETGRFVAVVVEPEVQPCARPDLEHPEGHTGLTEHQVAAQQRDATSHLVGLNRPEKRLGQFCLVGLDDGPEIRLQRGPRGTTGGRVVERESRCSSGEHESMDACQETQHDSVAER